ncbi:hypothetical protein J7T55_013101 [Diaporthe amygdali]|uniref:uncharacterized protein n=1 Tax=Phomopsis amygdali TaxID=1214568 RepID=UPI0022FE73A4|nr:uncharacterized protein J7T55_013101 [Diaporthe amygdali]KAJ0118845.1 hypothetical protein J7T55_013101 [Diaporthe amygdali]
MDALGLGPKRIVFQRPPGFNRDHNISTLAKTIPRSDGFLCPNNTACPELSLASQDRLRIRDDEQVRNDLLGRRVGRGVQIISQDTHGASNSAYLVAALSPADRGITYTRGGCLVSRLAGALVAFSCLGSHFGRSRDWSTSAVQLGKAAEEVMEGGSLHALDPVIDARLGGRRTARLVSRARQELSDKAIARESRVREDIRVFKEAAEDGLANRALLAGAEVEVKGGSSNREHKVEVILNKTGSELAGLVLDISGHIVEAHGVDLDGRDVVLFDGTADAGGGDIEFHAGAEVLEEGDRLAQPDLMSVSLCRHANKEFEMGKSQRTQSETMEQITDDGCSFPNVEQFKMKSTNLGQQHGPCRLITVDIPYLLKREAQVDQEGLLFLLLLPCYLFVLSKTPVQVRKLFLKPVQLAVLVLEVRVRLVKLAPGDNIASKLPLLGGSPEQLRERLYESLIVARHVHKRPADLQGYCITAWLLAADRSVEGRLVPFPASLTKSTVRT